MIPLAEPKPPSLYAEKRVLLVDGAFHDAGSSQGVTALGDVAGCALPPAGVCAVGKLPGVISMGMPGGLGKGSTYWATNFLMTCDALGIGDAPISTSVSSILAILAGGGEEVSSGFLAVLDARTTFTSVYKMQARSFVLPESNAVLRCTRWLKLISGFRPGCSSHQVV